MEYKKKTKIHSSFRGQKFSVTMTGSGFAFVFTLVSVEFEKLFSAIFDSYFSLRFRFVGLIYKRGKKIIVVTLKLNTVSGSLVCATIFM